LNISSCSGLVCKVSVEKPPVTLVYDMLRDTFLFKTSLFFFYF
jgi:hypothetical protein